MTSAHWAQVHSVTAISYLQAAAAHIRHTHGMTSFRTHHMGHHQTDTSAHNLFLNVSLCSRKERKEKKRKEKKKCWCICLHIYAGGEKNVFMWFQFILSRIDIEFT